MHLRYCTGPWPWFVLALIVRLIMSAGLNYYLSEMARRDYLIDGDADGYWILAQKIVAGEDYALYDPPRSVMRMPGFPAVLAVSQAIFGESHAAARYLLAILTSLAVFPAYWLGRAVYSARAGAWAAIIIAMMPVYVLFSVTLLTECLFATSLLWNLWAWAKWGEALHTGQTGKARWWAAGSGVWAAIAIYLRPSWLLFPVGLIAIWAWGHRSRWKEYGLECGLMLGCLFLALLPWGIRNQQVTGHFVLTTLWMGPSLYDGLHPGATGDSDMTFFDQERVLNRMSEYEMNKHYKDRAWEFVRQQPGRTLELAGIKFWRYWKPWASANQFRNPWLNLVLASGYLLLLAAAARGAWQIRHRWEFLFLCTLPIVYFSALHLLFVSSLRYRLPAEYPLTVLAGIGLCALLNRSERNHSQPLKTANDLITELGQSVENS